MRAMARDFDFDPSHPTMIGIGPRKEKALIFYFDREEKGLEE